MVSQAMWGAGAEQGGVQGCRVRAELPPPCGRVSHDRILTASKSNKMYQLLRSSDKSVAGTSVVDGIFVVVSSRV